MFGALLQNGFNKLSCPQYLYGNGLYSVHARISGHQNDIAKGWELAGES